MTDSTDRDSCAGVEQALIERLGRPDGEPAAAGAGVDRHLAACPRCAALENRLAEVLTAVRRDDAPDPGAAYWQGFGSRVRQALDDAPATPGLWRRWPVWSGLAAAAGLAVVLLRLTAGDTTPLPEGVAGGGQATVITQANGGGDADAMPGSDGNNEIDVLLDDFFGEAGLGRVSDPVGNLDDDERRQLLEELRAELDAAA